MMRVYKETRNFRMVVFNSGRRAVLRRPVDPRLRQFEMSDSEMIQQDRQRKIQKKKEKQT